MAAKTVLVLCACVALAIGAAVDPSTESQAPSNPASNIPGVSEIPNGVSIAEGFVKIPITIANGFANAFQGAIQSRSKRQVQNPADESQVPSNVPSSPNSESQLPSNPASNIPGASEIQNGATIAQGFVKIPISIVKGFADAIKGVIESRPKRQVPNPASAFQGFANAVGSLSSGSQSPSNIASNIPGVSELQNGASAAQGFASAGQGIVGRFQNAFNQTYQDERNSVSDSFNSVKDQIKQNVDTGANLTKTAFDLGTVVPKFGKNLVIGGK